MYIDTYKFKNAEDCLIRALNIRREKLGQRHSRVAQVSYTMSFSLLLYQFLDEF